MTETGQAWWLTTLKRHFNQPGLGSDLQPEGQSLASVGFFLTCLDGAQSSGEVFYAENSVRTPQPVPIGTSYRINEAGGEGETLAAFWVEETAWGDQCGMQDKVGSWQSCKC